MTRRTFSLAAAMALSTLSISASAQAPLERAVVSAAQAEAIIDGALAEASERDLQVSIVVVDPAGDIVAAHRMDGSGPVFFDVAHRKAYTSAVFRTPSSNIENNVVTGLDGSGKFWGSIVLDNVMPRQGALPIMHQGAVIGAVGTSGATPQEDELVSQAGLDAIAAN